ncbi:MAG TPA: thioredoxin domain-containing protein [Gammaproteobacteria bacterium]|nr:thioredoxin domain-containing protein [Gammaproteobacteria bacterium]
MDEEHDNDLGNELINETSPYLLQHAHNPVNWHPWSTDAIERARKQDKPILLSVGYSACHWCHVMMHESFMDADIAATMNRLFINIKVDKEERPDIDKTYQTAYQLLMGQPGGWPLTMFVSPTTLMPYYGGTYFPKQGPQGTLGFADLLHKLNDVFYSSKDRIKQQEMHTQALVSIMMQYHPAAIAPLAPDLIHKAEVALQREFDPAHGGFGDEVKFPNCPNLEFLLHSTDTMTRHIAFTTLNSMAEGGIYDQLGGGFFRYSVDEAWQIPHFEKMLYDNGQLTGIYAEAYALTQKENYRQIAIETGEWMQNNLLDANYSAFYTAFDADTEDQEGLYYLWDLQEVKHLLTHEEFASIKKFYNLDHKANFAKKWHLAINPHVPMPEHALLQSIKQKLLAQRATRVKPQIDNMILTGWNGLAIKGLSVAAKILAHEPFRALANDAIKFIRDNLYIDGQLYATWQNKTPKIHAFLDDYAFMLDAVLTFIDEDQEHEYMPFCITLANDLLAKFYDAEFGGFYFTAHDAEKLFYRPKTFTDDAVPSGNGIACLALFKLGKMLNNDEYINAVKKTVNCSLAFLHESPELHLNMCRAYSLVQEEG